MAVVLAEYGGYFGSTWTMGAYSEAYAFPKLEGQDRQEWMLLHPGFQAHWIGTGLTAECQAAGMKPEAACADEERRGDSGKDCW